MGSNKLIITLDAQSDIKNIYNYIESRLFNKPAAENLSQKLIKTFERIRDFPNSGIVIKNYRRVVVDSYLVFYKYSEKENLVAIAHVIYGAMDYDKFL